VQGNIHSKVAILSLRCQSMIYLKLYKMRRFEVKEVQKVLSEYQQKGPDQLPNGNTPSPLSPTNSVGSQVSFQYVLIFLVLFILFYLFIFFF